MPLSARSFVLSSLAILASSVLAFSAASAADVAGSSDHPLVGRYQGSEIVAYKVTEFDEVIDDRGAFRLHQDAGRRGFQDGRRQVLLDLLHAAPGPLDAGSRAQLRGEPESQGLLDRVHLRDRQGNLLQQRSGRGRDLSRSGRRRSEQHSQDGRRLRTELVQQGPLSARQARSAGRRGLCRDLSRRMSDRGNVAVVKVVETKEMETGKIEFINATQMDQAITDTGKVVIYGILFDFDKDVVKPDSKPTLDEIAKLLQGKPELKLKIVGHTDNKGTAEYNLDLSSRRAANVVAALTGSYGIAADRLARKAPGSPSRSPPTTPRKAGRRTAESNSWFRGHPQRRCLRRWRQLPTIRLHQSRRRKTTPTGRWPRTRERKIDSTALGRACPLLAHSGLFLRQTKCLLSGGKADVTDPLFNVR